MAEAVRKNAPNVMVFRPSMEENAKRQMKLERLIKEGLENDYFYLVFQPQYKLEGKTLRSHDFCQCFCK